MTNYLLAGGGTAGHVNPLLSLADYIVSIEPESKIWALGTREGLEAELVPSRGYSLLTIERLPFPRKFSIYASTFPFRFAVAISQTKRYLQENKIDVVVGFGGYASAPAYLAAKALNIPVVVHEANALPGWANKLGAKNAKAVGITFKSTPIDGATFVGMPLRSEIESLLGGFNQQMSRLYFGLDPDSVTLLVTGGSLGAKRINETIESSRRLFSAAGIQVLHIMGDGSELPEVHEKDYVRIPYCDRMDLAIAASNFAVSRAGSSTVSEFSAVGLPAAYIPYPVGNGEQKLNVADLIAVGGGTMVVDADFNSEYVANLLVPIISNSRKLADMSKKAKSISVPDGTARLYKLVKGVL